MEILSDATFKGNVSINGGNFSITFPGKSNPLIQTGYSKTGNSQSFGVYGSEFIHNDLIIMSSGNIIGHNGNPVKVKSGMCINGYMYVDGTEYINSTLDVQGVTYLHARTIISGEADFCSVTNFCETVNFHGGCVAIIGGALALGSHSIGDWNDLNDFLSFAKLKTFTSPSIPANCTAFEFTGTAISDSNKTHMIQVQNTSTGKSVIAETWMTTNKKPAMSFAGCTSTIAAGTYTAMVV